MAAAMEALVKFVDGDGVRSPAHTAKVVGTLGEFATPVAAPAHRCSAKTQ